jgi:hypothetical protein
MLGIRDVTEAFQMDYACAALLWQDREERLKRLQKE